MHLDGPSKNSMHRGAIASAMSRPVRLISPFEISSGYQCPELSTFDAVVLMGGLKLSLYWWPDRSTVDEHSHSYGGGTASRSSDAYEDAEMQFSLTFVWPSPQMKELVSDPLPGLAILKVSWNG